MAHHPRTQCIQGHTAQFAPAPSIHPVQTRLAKHRKAILRYILRSTFWACQAIIPIASKVIQVHPFVISCSFQTVCQCLLDSRERLAGIIFDQLLCQSVEQRWISQALKHSTNRQSKMCATHQRLDCKCESLQAYLRRHHTCRPRRQ